MVPAGVPNLWTSLHTIGSFKWVCIAIRPKHGWRKIWTRDLLKPARSPGLCIERVSPETLLLPNRSQAQAARLWTAQRVLRQHYFRGAIYTDTFHPCCIFFHSQQMMYTHVSQKKAPSMLSTFCCQIQSWLAQQRPLTSFKLQLFISLHNFSCNHTLNLQRKKRHKDYAMQRARMPYNMRPSRTQQDPAKPARPTMHRQQNHMLPPPTQRASFSWRWPFLGHAASGQLIAVSRPSLIKSSTYCFRHWKKEKCINTCTSKIPKTKWCVKQTDSH